MICIVPLPHWRDATLASGFELWLTGRRRTIVQSKSGRYTATGVGSGFLAGAERGVFMRYLIMLLFSSD